MLHTQKTDIEGFDGYLSQEILDDTPPNAVRTWFQTINVHSPALTKEKNRHVEVPVVHYCWEYQLGQFSGNRPIRDEVERDEVTGKWIVKRLCDIPGQSDILRCKEAWNAFARGTSHEAVGTPLTIIFPHSPDKVDRYKYYHIVTVEQLAHQNETSIQELGFGARADVQKARQFLEKTKDEGATIALSQELEKEREARAALEAKLFELTQKFNEVQVSEEDTLGQKRRRGKASVEVEASL